ncbi:LPS-assembly protein LptD [Pleomorphomonas diazotrophica]|uniref:LPS-assembly protein LptD n=1 Tax=Pleomorphomonas diazotrophica TaxID=1166257 RepID=A0A1I4U7I0_9HYPH|nr:LPS-assembly protein LptD [Pleomorphomonas diazotrophica]PKR91212.1 LPS-assembly protein LptD [Pleomorphomonas diazotrophica]SFM84912.1 LPS-assembly protein [Pleomorphomonas diazotrophica]
MRRSVVSQASEPTAAARLLCGVAVTILVFLPAGALAQFLTSNASLTGMISSAEQPSGDEKMMVEADTVAYDMDSDSVTATGRVVIYYLNHVVVADEVIVDRKSKRVTATGNVEITDPAGNVAHGDRIDLDNDLATGVAEGLELVTSERIAFTARNATRSNDNVTVFNDGTFLPCVDCNGVKGKKPIWQIRANRILHKQKEQTIVFENATFEFLGMPLAWVPVLSQPDPSVKQKTGVLTPSIKSSNTLGYSVKVPYYVALDPSYGLTLTPTVYTRQGLLFSGEWRQRLKGGEYTITLSGIHQNDPDAFAGRAGDELWRGSVESVGNFTINKNWSWGWDLAVASDTTFMDNYDLEHGNSDVAVNKVYLTGVRDRNRFDMTAYGLFVQQEDSQTSPLEQYHDLQEKQAYVYPVIDHKIYAKDPIWGGEASLATNFSNITRTRDDIYQIDSNGNGVFDPGEATRVRAAAGTFDRLSIDAMWRRRMVDQTGGVTTPFLYFRGDAIFSDPHNSSVLPETSSGLIVRGMPAAGLEYSYPVAMTSSVGNQIIEPIAQLIVRPNELEATYIPNEDAQSLVFDANSLFDYDKFSGYDRVEGGTRANVGFRYSGSFKHGFGVSGTFGQSFQLAGVNSFAKATQYSTGSYSGLESDVSDYVAGLSLSTKTGFLASSGVRFDNQNFEVNRFDSQILGIGGPLTAALTYAFIRSQPDLGIEDDRSELQAAASLRLSENWRVFGSSRYDLIRDEFVRHALGLAYDAEEFSISFSYSNDLTTNPSDQIFYLRAGFRTLGEVGTSFGIDN